MTQARAHRTQIGRSLLTPHSLEFPLALFDVHELAGLFAPLRPGCLAHEGALALRALADSAFTGIIAIGFVGRHLVFLCQLPSPMETTHRGNLVSGRAGIAEPASQVASIVIRYECG